MTHDKAVELAHHAMVNSKSRAHGLVDALIDLGVFEIGDQAISDLDARLKLLAKLNITFGLGPYYDDQILRALTDSNLKLVERK